MEPQSQVGGQAAARWEAAPVVAVAATISCWAFAFAGVRFTMQVFSPGHVALLRLMVASLVLAGYAGAARMPLPALRDWPVFLLFGLAGLATSTLALSYGLETVGSAAGSFLVGTIPVFSSLLSRFFLHERLAPLGWLGIAVSFAGVGLIGMGEGSGLQLSRGAGLLVLSAFVQSFFYVFQKPYHRRYSSGQITCYAVWGGTLWLMVFLPGLPAALAAAPGRYVAALVFLGIFPTALAFLMWSFALSRIKAAKVTSAIYVMPALAILIAYVWLGEIPPALTLLGGLTALAGVGLLNFWGK